MQRDRFDRWLPILIVIVGLILWEAAVRAGLVRALFFPTPTTIGQTLITITRNGTLPAEIGATLFRLTMGFLLGGVPGLLLGLLMGWSPRLRRIVDPFVAATHPIPKIAILPLILIVVGIGNFSKIVTVAISVFFPLLINSLSGVRQIDPTYFEVARSYGASRPKVLWRVVLPGSLPSVLAGIRLGLNTALLLTVAVELIMPQNGLGAMMWLAWQTLRIDRLYVGLLVAALLGIGFNLLLEVLTTRFVRWQRE